MDVVAKIVFIDEQRLLIMEMSPVAEYSVAAKPSVRKNGNHLSG